MEITCWPLITIGRATGYKLLILKVYRGNTAEIDFIYRAVILKG